MAGGGALSGMSMFVILGQLLTLDMSLTFYMTLSLIAFLLAQRSDEPADGCCWRGPPPGSAFSPRVPWPLPYPRRSSFSTAPTPGISGPGAGFASRGIAVVLVIAVPWHWLAARRDPDFLQFFFVHEHVARYLTSSADREAPWWFFPAVFLAGSVPWTLPALRVLKSGWRRRVSGEFDPALFLWIWIVFVAVFFSLSDSKLMPYILPACRHWRC